MKTSQSPSKTSASATHSTKFLRRPVMARLLLCLLLISMGILCFADDTNLNLLYETHPKLCGKRLNSCKTPTGQLAGRVAVITGASRGVGAEIARVFAREGALVVVNYYQSKEKGEAVAAEINAAYCGRAVAIYGDVRVKEDMTALVVRAELHFGTKVNVLVNNALATYQFNPSSPSASVKTVTWENVDQQMRGAVGGALHAVQSCLPSFEAANFGKIINIGTNLVYNPVVTYYDYSAAKAALVSLTRNLAAELGPLGVRANLVAGGLLERTDASALTTDEVFG